MQLHFWHNIRRFWPIVILVFIEMCLAATNYRPGTYLMGWDNVMPEFNFRQAFITNIFGAWQEHRGVGLPDGMGHAANLIHTIFTWILSLLVPQSTIRYIVQFFLHFVGMVGMLTLLKSFTSPRSEEKNNILALLGALFYGLNLITIQMFYTPLEAFSVHFAALPWLAYTLTEYLNKPHRNTLLLFITASIFSTPQFFIPTLILPTTILLVGISLFHLRIPGIRAALIAGISFLCVNAFWILPYIYHLPQNSPIIQHAKINEMSSSEVYARNQVFGDLSNVLSMRGFMLDFEDVNTQGLPIYVMDTWRTFTALPGIQMASLLLAGMVLIGFVATLLDSRKHTYMMSYALLYGASFIFLATNTPIVKDAMGFLRDNLPLFSEAYRFTFTKFGILFGFSSTIMIVQFISFARRPLLKLVSIFYLVTLIAILGISWPVFQGQFFYDALRVKLPNDYAHLFAFMDEKDHTGRTAYLPSPSYWSWKHYKYGYVGSGFLWYGLSQPLMDRAFDPWSNTNENYYWELSRALYAKDTGGIASVFNKYDIRYIIFDENLWAPGHDKSLFIADTKELLAALPDTRMIGKTNTISVYNRTANTDSFVRVTNTLPSVFPSYSWTDNDYAYRAIGDYTNAATDKVNTITYPFRSLFTKRAIDEREFTIDETSTDITIKSNTLQDSTVNATIEKATPVYSARASGVLTIQAIESCGVLKQGSVTGQDLTDENRNFLRITSQKQRGCVHFGAPSLNHTHAYLIRVTSRHITGRPLIFSLINDTAKHVEIETLLREDVISLASSSANWQTDYFILPPLGNDGQGYSAYITNDAIGEDETVHDIEDITFYAFPYEQLANTHTDLPIQQQTNNAIQVVHSNPSSYKVDVSVHEDMTLILSQAYNMNWRAYDVTNLSAIQRLFPWIFGTEITNHYIVNNWANGWRLTGDNRSIIIIFLPQLLEYLGFILFLLPGILILRAKT